MRSLEALQLVAVAGEPIPVAVPVPVGAAVPVGVGDCVIVSQVDVVRGIEAYSNCIDRYIMQVSSKPIFGYIYDRL